MTRYVFLILFLISSKGLSAPCANMSLQLPNTNIDLTSNPAVNATVTVQANTQPGGCDFFITFDYGTASSFSSRVLTMSSFVWPFQVAKDSSGTNILKQIPDATTGNDVLFGTLPDSSGSHYQMNMNFWVLLDQSNPWRRFGNYTEQLTMRLYQGTVGSSGATLVDSKNFSVNYNAPKKTDVSIVNTGGSFNLVDTTETLNFGNLTTGAVRTCDIIARTNAGYILFASSQNNGRLKHTLLSQFINYTIRFSGNIVSLTGSSSNPVEVQSVFGVSPSNGFIIPTSVTIGNVAGAFSGSYQDIVTLTVQSKE